MTSFDNLDSRLANAENRISRLEDIHQGLCKLRRSLAHSELTASRLREHLGLPPVTEEEIDAAMESEWPSHRRPWLGKAT